MKRVGLFGGTFDPIHFGHLNLALELQEIHKLDEVLFCPAARSPFKEAIPPIASPQDRYKLVELALKGFPRFQITPIEIDRGGISYTIDTLSTLMISHPDTRFNLLLSEEAAVHFPEWKEAERLAQLAPPLIGSRRGYTPRFPQTAVGRALQEGVTPTRVFEISSTEVRKRLREGLPCGHLIPALSLDWILLRRLFAQ